MLPTTFLQEPETSVDASITLPGRRNGAVVVFLG